MNEIKIKATVLKRFLENDKILGIDSIGFNPFTELFSADGKEYKVLNENEAFDEVSEYIKKTLNTFNTSLLAQQTGISEEVFDILMQQDENSNKTIGLLIDSTIGMSKFTENVIKLDGIPYFLSSFDEGIIERFYDDDMYYICRIS